MGGVFRELIEFQSLSRFILYFLKYGENWENKLPKSAQNDIEFKKKKEFKAFAMYLSNEQKSLNYLGRSQYSSIICDEILWNECFKHTFGTNYYTYVKETLENLANQGNLPKHNRSDEELQKIAPLIQSDFPRIKELLEKINNFYFLLMSPSFMKLRDEKLIFWLYSEKCLKDYAYEVNVDNCEKLIIDLNQSISSSAGIEKKINFADFDSISHHSSLSYRDYYATLGKLILDEKVKIEHAGGSTAKLIVQ